METRPPPGRPNPELTPRPSSNSGAVVRLCRQLAAEMMPACHARPRHHARATDRNPPLSARAPASLSIAAGRLAQLAPPSGGARSARAAPPADRPAGHRQVRHERLVVGIVDLDRRSASPPRRAPAAARGAAGRRDRSASYRRPGATRPARSRAAAMRSQPATVSASGFSHMHVQPGLERRHRQRRMERIGCAR